jgi:plasmid maintenance system killer protein
LNITFVSQSLEKECNNERELRRRHGKDQATRIGRRLDDLHAAASLEDMRNLPGRCHELKGTRSGQLSLDLDHPYRLIFEAADNPVPRKPDGGLSWPDIRNIRIIGVIDTHE